MDKDTGQTEQNFSSEIGDGIDIEESFKEKCKNIIKQNKLAFFSLIMIILIILCAVFANVICRYNPYTQSLKDRLLAPSFAHPLGTDELGRDTLTRVIFGARISLTIGLIPTLISMFIGTILGLVAGYFGGKIDFIIMRFADIMLAFPSLLLAMVVMYTMGGGLINIFIALSLVNWASTSRVVRSETLSLSKKEYVEAAKSMGVGNAAIILRHILPNCIPTLVVLFTLSIPSAILSESSLSFLGVGAQPPTASWGLMVVSAKKYLFTQPVMVLAPAIAIMTVVLAFNFLGDGLRDILDPYLKER